MIQNDRTKTEPTYSDVSDAGLGDDIRSFIAKPVSIQPDPTPRTRNLRATFRVAPGAASPSTDPGFPGTRSFSAHRVDRREAGAVIQPASAGDDLAPAPVARADDSPRRGAAIQQAGADSTVVWAAFPADQSPDGGRVRGRSATAGTGPAIEEFQSQPRRRGRPPGSGKKKPIETSGAEGLTIPIAQPIPVGTRVSITDPSHPWHTYGGRVVSGVEKYGLGWFGQRVDLDGTNGEAIIRPEQTNWKKPIETSLPKAIAKLLPKDEGASVPAPSTRLVPTEEQRADARHLFREIGETFNVNRKKSKTAAYAAYRHDLMANLDTLIMGGAIDLKEVTTVITNLEQYTKETEAESTETPATVLGRWLRMDASEVAGLEVGAPVAEEEESGEEIDELDAAADPADDGDSEAIS